MNSEWVRWSYFVSCMPVGGGRLMKDFGYEEVITVIDISNQSHVS